jgi:hypothetical protein
MWRCSAQLQRRIRVCLRGHTIFTLFGLCLEKTRLTRYVSPVDIQWPRVLLAFAGRVREFHVLFDALVFDPSQHTNTRQPRPRGVSLRDPAIRGREQ